MSNQAGKAGMAVQKYSICGESGVAATHRSRLVSLDRSRCHRSHAEARIAGVAAVVLTVLGFGWGIIIYAALWVIMPYRDPELRDGGRSGETGAGGN